MNDPLSGPGGAALDCLLSGRPERLEFRGDQDQDDESTLVYIWTGGVEAMGLVSAACYNAGYRGHFFHYLTSDVGLLAPVFKPEVLESYVCGCSAMEVDPVYTPWAKEMKDAWIAKFAKWDFADYMTTPLYTALKAAMQKAGSIEVDKVNAALHTPGPWNLICPDGRRER